VPRPWGVTTHNGTHVYIHVLDWSDAPLLVPLRQTVSSARLLRDGRNIPLKRRPDGIELALPSPLPDEWDRVIRLDMHGAD